MFSSQSLRFLRSIATEQHVATSLQSWTCRACQKRPRRRPSAIAYRKLSTETKKPAYVTTPIFYVNAAPHIGHLYSMVLADTIKRWELLKGCRAILATGIDEHGMKVQRAAAKAGSEPLPFCDNGAETFKQLAKDVELQNDIFVRTSSEQHHDAVQYAWDRLRDQGLIYMAEHSGWYSVSDETFVPNSGVQLIVDPPTGRKMMVSIETGKEVEWTKEMNYKFDLPSFQSRLLEHYDSNENAIISQRYSREIIAQIKAGLEPLSVSRPSERLTWGIPVPNDETQTIYVWLDALMNYVSILGYPWAPGTSAMADAGWPADVQVIGKDITRFHCIYWPAFLMALGLPLPKHILVHGHWTMSRMKMSKSTGNVVNPFFALERFGADPMRFYLLRDGPTDQDSDYDNHWIITRYKSELQGALGNLASRLVRGKWWSVRMAVERSLENVKSDKMLSKGNFRQQREAITQISHSVEAKMRSLDVRGALAEIFEGVHATNRFVQHAQPWGYYQAVRHEAGPATLPVVPKGDEVIFLAVEMLRVVGILLQPFIPGKAAQLLDLLGVADDRRSLEWAELCKDDSYGTPKEGVKVGAGLQGVLFPPLSCED